MNDFEYLKQIGIEFPKDIVFTKQDWHDFYVTLAEFKKRVLKRHGIKLDFLGLLHKSERGA